MGSRLLTCGLLAALVGCSSAVDRSYDPPKNGPLAERQGQVPPGTQPAWQPNGGLAAAFRAPDGPQDPRPTPPVNSPSVSGYNAAGNGPGRFQTGFPGPDGPEAGRAPVRQASYEDKPLRVIDPGAPAAHDPLLADLPPALPPVGGDPAAPDPGSRRRVTRPGADGGGPPPAPPKMPASLTEQALLMAGDPADTPAPRGGTEACEPKEKEGGPRAETARPPGAVKPGGRQDPGKGPAGGPAVRMVNTRRIVLNYEVKDVGPSGVSSVELWCTRDGQQWHKDETAVRTGPPYVTEVPEEGMYGFTLLAKSGLGLGKKPPQRGDSPQVWVEVDLTKPAVSLTDVRHGLGAKAREVTITWSATDRNLARRPITLAYAEKAGGPWVPFAANIENTGKYVWAMPAGAPNSFLVRVEAVDLVGNVGSAQSAKPLVIDMSQPSAVILGVDSAEK